MINVSESLAVLCGESTSEDDEDTYFTDSDILSKMHAVLWDAGEAGSITGSPAVFAWAILTHWMFNSHQQRLEKRDNTQQLRAVTSFEQNYEQGCQSKSGRRNSDASMVSMEVAAYDQFLSDSALVQDFRDMERIAMSVIGKGELFLLLSEMASGLGDSLDAMFPAGTGSRMRLVLLSFIGCTHPFVQYQTEPVTALLSTLAGGKQYWDISRADHLDAETDILAQALRNTNFLDQYFTQSLHRYPFEFLPFIEFCRILSSCQTLPEDSDECKLVLRLLSFTPSLTFILPDDFQGYELALDEENSNAFRLTDGLELFPETAISWSRRSAGPGPFTIPTNTSGRFVADSGRVVQLDYKHSSLALIGKRLEAELYGRQYRPVLGDLEASEIAASISLLATLIRTETLKGSKQNKGNAWDNGISLLEEIGSALSRNKDVIAIVCDILDQQLQEELAEPDDAAMSILTACIQFINSVLPIAPGRVWSYMTRCPLLNTETQAGRLSKITANLDIVLDRFDFLISSMQLMRDMVDSAMRSSVQRKAPTQLKGRIENIWAGTSDKLLARVCFAIAQTAVDIFENSSTWRFSSELHRTTLIRNVVPILTNIIVYSFGLGDGKPPSNVTGCLYPAAMYIVDGFLTPSAGSLRFQPILATLLISFQLHQSTLYPRKAEAFSDRLISILRFATSLVRIGNLLERPQTVIEAQLFKAASLLARICAVNSTFRRHSLELLEALVISAASYPGEPPSLLGYLSAEASKSFLSLLSTLDRPFNQTNEVNRIWRFFTAILQNRQQWMANCLLTGRMPRDAASKHRKNDKDGQNTSQDPSSSVLKLATNRLATVKQVPSSEVLLLLDFVTSALNYYPWTVFSIHKEGSLVDGLREYIHFLSPTDTIARTNMAEAIYQCRIAAYIAEFFAMLIYHLRQIGGADEMAEHLMQDVDYYLRDGVSVAGYNSSLHANFGRNFERQFQNFKLEDFKRTLLEPRELGTDFFYTLELADCMLDFDPGWVGSKNNGFRNEMERANNNLSLVDAQVALFHAWEFLLMELTNCLPSDKHLPTKMMQVASQCLAANDMAQGPERFFQRVSQSRANLCLLLVQRLVEKTPKFSEISSLLKAVWASISVINMPFASGDPTYYRTLLKILFVTLRAYLRHEDYETADKRGLHFEQAVLNIVDKVVAQNFRTLVTLIHDPVVHTDPADVALITAILQACLGMPGIEDNQTQLLNIMASQNIIHVAIALYSWSDKLARKEGSGISTTANGGAASEHDPIYGELSLLLLRELSTMPQIAETMAAEGLLSQIVNASITSHIRRPSVGPLADSAAAQRCYNIWVKCIIPILVNVLKAVGATIAPEVALVLNQFPHLLNQSILRLEPPAKTRITTSSVNGSNRMSLRAATLLGSGKGGLDGGYLTLLAVSELQGLALLHGELSALRRQQPGIIPEVKWDARVADENVELWLSGSKKLLRDRIIAIGVREVEWRGQRCCGNDKDRVKRPLVLQDCENRLEERIVAALVEARSILATSGGVESADGAA